jgi:Ca2+-binding RTX toxin-like protein
MAIVIGKNPYGEKIDYADGVTDFSDVIVGNAGADLIKGGGGHDAIKGGGGADFIDGGSGIDTAYYDDSSVGVTVNISTGTGKYGTAEGDTLVDIENLFGSAYNDRLIGNSGENRLEGAGGNDTLKGIGAADELLGGAGDDTIYVDGIDDVVDGGSGVDTLVLASDQGLEVWLPFGWIEINPAHDFHFPDYPNHRWEEGPIQSVENVIGSNFADYIVGTAAPNVLSGGGGDDDLIGADGNDELSGGAGNDVVWGGTGIDILSGGPGGDIFAFGALDESPMGKASYDRILDFEPGVDQIDLSWLDFPLTSLLIEEYSQNGVNYANIGVDANGDGHFDTGGFMVNLTLVGGNSLMSGDLIL